MRRSIEFQCLEEFKSWGIRVGIIMTILVFKGVKDEDSKLILRNYKMTCISTRRRSTENRVLFLLEFLEGRIFQ